jgi:DNA invertase Pin-like site-specific DNA recombinase
MNDLDWIGRNNKAIAPLRVSSAGQEDNTSWITQKRDCEDYCRDKGLELIEAVEIVETARKSELRTKYKSVISKALKAGIQHVIFHKYDRETRNLKDNESNEDLVKAGKITLHYIADQKILHKHSPDSEFFNRDIQAAINKNYSRDLSTKVRKGTQTKAKSGWWPGNCPPKGYINQKLKSKKGFERRRGAIVVPDPDPITVKRVQREFEIRAEKPTPSLREVRNRIIIEGLVIEDDVKKYHIGSIERRLKNIFYDCRYEWHGIEYTGKHKRIIPEATFWKVQETFGSKTPYRKNIDALFGQSWMKCGDPACGCVITFDPKTKRIKKTGETKTYRYYRCSNGKRVHSKLKSVSEEQIMIQFGNVAREITIAEDFRGQLLKTVNETLVKSRRAVKDDLDRYQASLQIVDGKENLAYDHFASGVIDLENYNRQRKRLQDERKLYANLMQQAQLAINGAALETVESIIELATNAESLWKHMTTEERRILLEKVLSNRVLNDVTVEYEIIKPLRTLGEMKLDEKWRREGDSNPRYQFYPVRRFSKPLP